MSSPLVVIKFGSSVLETHDCLTAAAHEVYRYYRRGRRVLVVVSAVGRHTEVLFGQARQWMDPAGPERAVAELLATGEQQSAALFTMALSRAGIDATVVTPAEVGLTLRGDRLDAWPVAVDVKSVDEHFQAASVLVIAGFAGVHETGGTALMGRGGSDLTAVFLAGALRAAECRLIKDVDGVYERDPAAAASTAKLPHRYDEVTYEDALEVAGALVQPKAIAYLRERKTKARVAGLLRQEDTFIGAAASTFQDLPRPQPLTVLLLGLGQVGQGVYYHLQHLEAFFELTGIHVRDTGKTRDFPVPDYLLSTHIDELMERPHDLIVDVCGDASIARRAIEASLAAGCSVVTASKQLVAEHGPALSRLSAGNGSLRYSAAIGGAAPMIETLERARQAGPVRKLRGVLNGTCNFVLDRLAEGIAFHTAVSQARLRGFAESNVSRDLQGDDSADKVRILARLAFGVAADGVPIGRQSLSPATSLQLVRGASNGRVVRQVATFDPGTGASVELETLVADDYLAGAREEESRLIITGADGREWRVRGKGAGRWPTAEAVIADMLDVHAWLGARTRTGSQGSSVHSGSDEAPARGAAAGASAP